MADAYSPGGGGGIVRPTTENTRYGLDKPYEFDGGWGPDQINQLNEMLTYLFRNHSKGERNHLALDSEVTALNTTIDSLTSTELITLSTSITEAELEAGNTTPITIVPAVTDKIVFFAGVIVKVTVTTVYSNNPAVSIRHRSLAGNLSGATNAYNFSVGTGDKWGWFAGSDNGSFTGDPTGLDLVLFLNADLTGSGVATAEVATAYYLLDPA